MLNNANINSLNAPAPLPPPLPRRVTYVIPTPNSPPPLLSIPPITFDKRGLTAPIYSQRPAPAGFNYDKFIREHTAPHPRHRLAVQALAFDLSTPVSNHGNESRGEPGGILYTGARDGLLCSWELNLPTKRRRRRYGRPTPDDQDQEEEQDEQDESSEDEMDVATMPFSAEPLEIDGLGERSTVETSRAAVHARSRSHKGIGSRTDTTASHLGLHPEERWEINPERLTDAPINSRFRQCVQSHTDWINDIVLCNSNRTLISASSDSLVLAWNPHSPSQHDQVTPHPIGRHSDYVRCLTGARDAGWVASGGFDRKIKLWDLGEGRSQPLVDLASPASAYSLSSTTAGNMLAVGSPERVVRVWDPRSRSQVARLGGHTDNVRGVLIGEDGKWVLSASSDSTVKLWSLTAQKCLHTFSHHIDSVWSLFSQHPSLEIFYSGDRVGNLCKIDLQGTGDPGEGECILLARDQSDDHTDARGGSSGITQIVAQDDSYVWTAGSSSSVKTWRDVAPRIRRAGAVATRSRQEVEGMVSAVSLSPTSGPSDPTVYPLAHENASNTRDRPTQPAVSFLEDPTIPLSRTTSSPSPLALAGAPQLGVNRPSSLRARALSLASNSASRSSFSTQVNGGSSNSLYDIPYSCLIPLTSPEDSYFSPTFLNRARDPEAATIYSSVSVSSIPTFGLSTRSAASVSPMPYRRPQSISEPQLQQETSLARRDFDDRNDCTEASPLRTSTTGIIQGGHGLMRCELLNDRRHVLTLDTEDEVALWDIVRCECLGVFEPEELQHLSRRASDAVSSFSGSVSSTSEPIHSGDLLDFVRERVEGEATVANWCKCDARVGSLVVHLEERVFDGEVYADESVARNSESDFGPDHRLVLGKLVLRNLFDQFIEAELEVRGGGGTPVQRSRREVNGPNFISLTGLMSPLSQVSPALKTPGMTIALATPALNKALLPMTNGASVTSPRMSDRSLVPIPQSPIPNHHEPIPLPPTGAETMTPGTKTPMASGRSEGDYFSLPTAAPETAQQVPSTPVLPSSPPLSTPGGGGGSLMGRLRNFGKASRKSTIDTLEVASTVSAISEPVETETRTIEEQQQFEILRSVFSQPIAPCSQRDAPTLPYREDMAVVISEETPDSSAWTVTYRGLVGTGREDMGVLEQKAPLWLLDFLLGNRTILKEPVKLSFLIQAWKGEDGSASLPELPNSNARLTANRTLRLRKVTGYVADRLQLGAPPSREPSISSFGEAAADASSADLAKIRQYDDFNAENDLEILVGGVVLPLNVTIATARAFYWRGGGDLVLHYRLKSR